MIEPTPDEAKNGWTPEKLAEYRAEADQSAAMVIGRVFGDAGRMTANGHFIPSRPVTAQTVKTFNPLRW
jgi:hypothetical protein